MSEKHRCETVFRRIGYLPEQCARNGAYEHEGKHFCKLHHPPSIEAKAAAKLHASRVQWDREAADRQAAMDAAAEQKRRADLFPELVEALQPFVVHNNSDEVFAIKVRSADVTRAREVLVKAGGTS